MEVVGLPLGPARVAWRRSSRARRVSLRIDAREAAVVVTMPVETRRAAGLRFLLRQADWVSASLAALPAARPFADGKMVPVDGVDVCIRHVPDLRGAPVLRDGALWVGGTVALVPIRARIFLRDEARRRFAALAEAKAELAFGRLRRVVIKDTRTRWGSCAPDGTLAFSWRLVMAPAFVQDYVAGHEVAHLRHMNHGAEFWELVAALTPHRAASVAWLAAHGPGLLRTG